LGLELGTRGERRKEGWRGRLPYKRFTPSWKG